MHVRTPFLLAAGLLAGTLLPMSQPASADTGPVSLGMADLGRVVADEVHGRLFLSEGPRGTGVHVTDLSGVRVTTIPGLSGATGMALTPDGGSLWVAVPAAGLARVDTSSLTVVQRIALPTGTCAGDVAVSGSRLVYGYSCAGYSATRSGDYGGIAVVDASDGTPRGSVTSGPFHEPRVATGPAGQVYAGDAGSSPTAVHLYDVAGAAPVVRATSDRFCSNLQDLASSPDGALVAPACGAPYEHRILSGLSGLAVVASHTTGAYPSAAAWSADGGTFAAGTDDPYGPDVRLYAGGSTTASRTVDFGSTSERLAPRGLAVSRDGSRAWAVTVTTGGGVALRVLHDGGVVASSLTLAADPPEVYEGLGTHLGGWLSSDGKGIPGVTLLVYRGPAGTAGSPLPTVTTRADGTFSFTDVPPTAGDWTYTVVWQGDSTRARVQSTTVVVVRPRTSTTVQLDVSPGTTAGTVAGTVTLSSPDASTVGGRFLYLDRDGTWLNGVTTDSQGTAAFVDMAGPGTHTYTVHLQSTVPGTGTEAKASSTVSVPAAPAPTTLHATAASGAVAGDPLVVGGTLMTAAGPVSGGQVFVVRSGCGPTGWQSPPTTTAGDGRWSVTDPAPNGGTCTYTATYGGSSTHAGSQGVARAAVALRPTELSLTVTRGTGSAKKQVLVAAQLGTTRSNRTVRLTVQPSGGAETFLAEGTVDATGRFTAVHTPKTTTTYRVTFAGDEWYARALASRTQ